MQNPALTALLISGFRLALQEQSKIYADASAVVAIEQAKRDSMDVV
jgi:hypothetical protein